MDAIMRRVQSNPEKTPSERLDALPVRLGMVVEDGRPRPSLT